MKRLMLGGIILAVLIVVGIFVFIFPKGNNSLPSTETESSNPVSIPENIEKNCIGFDVGMPEEISLVSEIGGAG